MDVEVGEVGHDEERERAIMDEDLEDIPILERMDVEGEDRLVDDLIAQLYV